MAKHTHSRSPLTPFLEDQHQNARTEQLGDIERDCVLASLALSKYTDSMMAQKASALPLLGESDGIELELNLDPMLKLMDWNKTATNPLSVREGAMVSVLAHCVEYQSVSSNVECRSECYGAALFPAAKM